MRVLILNTSDFSGGAAVAANRLMKALRKSDVDVTMLVRDKKTNDVNVVSLNTSFISKKINFIRFIWERIIIFLCSFFNRDTLFQVSIANTGLDISTHPLVQKADIIHLHWINQGFLSLSDLEKLIATEKPIIWTMHDLWASTAICHYPNGCEKYINTCFACPMSKPNSFFDLANFVFKRKASLEMSNIMFVGCSRWIMEEARKSTLIKKSHFASIPNPIDTTIYKPVNKEFARNRFGLPNNKLLLLFAAAKLSDTRKGAAYLIKACNILANKYKNDIEVVLMGSCSEELVHEIPLKVNILGYISEQQMMTLAYNCADLFVIPSLEDNLPNTIMESMACGTPCVGFNTGGIPEMIDHKVNGYIAKYKDAVDLANGIQWIFENRTDLILADACVEKVRKNYSESVVSSQYKLLYEGVLACKI